MFQDPHSPGKFTIKARTSNRVWEVKAEDNTVRGKLIRKLKRKFGVEVCMLARCGHVVRDFESEAKTRCNFQF